MCSFLKGKGSEVWYSVEKGPHIRTWTRSIVTGVDTALRGDSVEGTRMLDDPEKMKADTTTFTKLIYVIHPDI